ncbi:uncharacterized protein LOC112341692 [Selaginella moellendorffii]|uniref:uncharacterized protein LOC112341692 n=1 Tax=Selaginella moellendorffii TaxID=88036 RepID=UPI000D1C338B|nr:uncharacterized protein LOC112341692 [Selaginella moellendorffii]|eukprot:XP_024518048.1 uncharacterized protein LOC112341692 [Selaginella moellendorffii]
MAWMAMPTTVLNNHPPLLLPSLLEALKRTGEERVAAFHFPGHGLSASSISKLLGAQLFQFDLPELPGLATRSHSRSAANDFGAGYSWFLVNGSMCGIQAAVMSCCKRGDVSILPTFQHSQPWFLLEQCLTMLFLVTRGCKIVKHERICKCLRTLQSSSPSYHLLASLDAARDQMSCAASDDHPAFDTALELASTARRRLKESQKF